MNIYESIQVAMNECGAVGKDSTNDMQKYKYRGIDAVMNALNPALRKAHIFTVPEVIEVSREERATNKGGLLIYSIVKVKYTFFAEDGTYVIAVVTGEGMDSGDKSLNKAMSSAYKYALFQVFCIPIEEMIDSEKDSPDPAPKEITIDQIKINALIKKCAEENVDFQKILKSYKIKSLKELTEKQHATICKHWEEAKVKWAKDEAQS